MITNIPIERLQPHPNNPRKDLGDLSELTESIKTKGVLQNLTVVPGEEGWCPSCMHINLVYGDCAIEKDKERERDDDDNLLPCPSWENSGNYTVVIGHRRLAAAKAAGLAELLNINNPVLQPADEDDDDWEEPPYYMIIDIVAHAVRAAPELMLFRLVYKNLADSEENVYRWFYNTQHKENINLDAIYRLLTSLGYGMSEEEKKLQDGTHEAYYKKPDPT